VNIDQGIVHVTQSLQATADGLVFEAPKTERSRRPISLPGFAVALLKRHRKEQAERRLLWGSNWKDFDLVSTEETGARGIQAASPRPSPESQRPVVFLGSDSTIFATAMQP
jgi:hypothetical protein